MAKRDQDAFSRLLTSLYGGLLEEPPWEGFLRCLAGWLDATYASLILTAPGMTTPAALITPGVSRDDMEDYAGGYFGSDPFTGLPEGEVTSFTDFLGGAAARQSDFYQNYLATAGGDQILGVDLRFASGFEARLRVTRDHSLPDFDLAARRAFQSVVPHLRYAINLFEKLQLDLAEHGIFGGAIEQLGVGAIILDHDGKVVRVNAVATRLLESHAGFSVVHDRLQLYDSRQQRELMALLHSLSADTSPVRFRIRRADGEDLPAVARPIAKPAFMHGGAALALFVSEPRQSARLDADAIRDLFQLTPSEANLVAALADGRPLPEAAEALGIAYNTARAHLRSIFAKTGVRRQSQLAHLVRDVH